LTLPMMLHFWWRMTSAFAVIISMVSSVFVAGIALLLDNRLREGARVDAGRRFKPLSQ
jgi:Na+-transporting NADH:ubiquinone oxidoreductase subunit NqrC